MDHRFELDNFAGPLDLLLYLVQREEVDIRSVSLINICDQYLKVLKSAKHKNIELAGEFLVLAATLMLIKWVEQLDEATRNHARDALEYAASVVEFDAFDRVWKTSQPKQSLTQYTAEGLQYSKKALEAVDRELGLFVFGCKVKGRSYFGVS